VIQSHRTAAALGLLVLLSVLARITFPGESDLHPWPDSPEYAATAVGLLERGSFRIPYAGQWVPPGHGFGFPLFIAPVLALLGHDFSNAIWATLVMHVVELLLVFRLAARCYGPAAGLLAVAFLAGSPVDAELSRRIMSEVPSSTMIVAALLFLCGAASAPGPARLFACGLTLSVACWFRYVNALLVIPFAVAVFLVPSRLSARLLRAWALLAGFLLGLVPVAAYDLITLGAVTRMPHSIWVAEHETLFHPFRLRHALPEGKAARYVAALLGSPDDCLATTQALYPSFVAALAMASYLLVPRRAGGWSPAAMLERVAAAIVAVLLAVASFYFFETELRFLHAAIPIVCTVAAGAAIQLFSPPIPRGLGRLGYAVLCLAALAWPAWMLGRTVADGPVAQRLAGIETPPAVARAHMKLINESTEPDAWIVSDNFEPVFFNVEQTAQRRLLLIDEEGVEVQGAAVESVAEVPGSLEKLFDRGMRVYFVGNIDKLERRGWLDRYAIERVAARGIDHNRITMEVFRLTRR
jgi:4-amino-4-deoxy-L-arabinose transferase-like glycosyltransferase